jgi:2-keto-4-pentenoate hydratase/2-oxohepta-3-ene-1,7-dioic acid hydratase in catechol pathway
MRLITYREAASGTVGLAVRRSRDLVAVDPTAAGLPARVEDILSCGPAALQALERLATRGSLLDDSTIEFLPTIRRPGKVLCVGLNYADHVAESPYPKPTYPTIFPRYATSLIGHRAPIVRPQCSVELDYEGELVAVVGRRGRHIPKERALEFVAGYACFNEASIRDYQFKTPQWAVGKNFDDTGAFGPELVTADELPPGAAGLRIQTRLNGQTVQSSNTGHLLFDVATIIATISECMTFEPGDLIATGTPEGVGLFRKPPLFMKDGDVVQVEIEGIGVLENPVRDEVVTRAT